MISSNTPSALDVVLVQRDSANTVYGEVHISGSNIVIYIDNNGNLTAGKASEFYSVFPTIGASGTFTAGANTITVVNGLITNIA